MHTNKDVKTQELFAWLKRKGVCQWQSYKPYLSPLLVVRWLSLHCTLQNYTFIHRRNQSQTESIRIDLFPGKFKTLKSNGHNNANPTNNLAEEWLSKPKVIMKKNLPAIKTSHRFYVFTSSCELQVSRLQVNNNRFFWRTQASLKQNVMSWTWRLADYYQHEDRPNGIGSNRGFMKIHQYLVK